MALLCLAKAGLQRRAVPAVCWDQGLCLIQGRGPGARGNFRVCPQAAKWDLAPGSPAEAAQLSGPALAQPLAGSVQLTGLLCRGTGGSAPQVFEKKIEHVYGKVQAEQREDGLGSHRSQSSGIIFSFLLNF